MPEGFERKNINEVLQKLITEIRQTLDECMIDCDSELVEINRSGNTMSFSVPSFKKHAILEKIQNIARKPEFIDYKFDSTLDGDYLDFSVEYAPGYQMPVYKLPDMSLPDIPNDIPELIRQVFDTFTTQLYEEQFEWQVINSTQPRQVQIVVPNSAFTYETFQKILTYVEHPGVTIGFDADNHIISFGVLQNWQLY